MFQDIFPHVYHNEFSKQAPRAADHILAFSGRGLLGRVEDGALLLPTQAQMLNLGVLGGNADQVMAEIAGDLMTDARQSLEDSVSRIEPAMVLVSSLLVGLILLSVMLPLIDIMSTIG